VPFLLLFGASYFFAEFGPNTTTFVYPAEIFPVRVRTTSHGIGAAGGKIGVFIGTYALTALPAIGLSRTSPLVAGVAVLGLLATLTCCPSPRAKPGGSHRTPIPGRRCRAGRRGKPR
jgi:PHS family inorganic phosphate transporter-like MFS transporter